MEDEIILTEEQLLRLADNKCPACGGPLQASGFFPDTVMCRNRNQSELALCKMYFASPKKVIEGMKMIWYTVIGYDGNNDRIVFVKAADPHQAASKSHLEMITAVLIGRHADLIEHCQPLPEIA